MPRLPARLLILTTTLIALLFLSPSFAAALPLEQPGLSAAEHSDATPGLFSKLWGFLSAVWTNGSILEPDGSGASSGSGSEPNAATGDTGSILDPDG